MQYETSTGRYLLAAGLGAILGAIAAAIATIAIPTMMSRLMSDRMAKVMARMGGEDCNPEEMRRRFMEGFGQAQSRPACECAENGG